jgi:hypothetical protein
MMADLVAIDAHQLSKPIVPVMLDELSLDQGSSQT